MPKKSEKSMPSNEPANSPSSSSEHDPTAEAAQLPSSEQPAAPRMERHAPSNHIYVGKKPVMSYAMSAIIQLTQSDEIILKARGMVISRAVDVAEIVCKRLGNNNYAVKDIKIDTEVLGEGDDRRNVSTIEITVGKK